jgi:putative protease
MYQRLGAERIILARELTLEEIAEIKQCVPEVELEVFVHGAMCMSYSGRCNISSYLTGRDGNRGACSNPCRWQYALMEEKRPGEYFPVYEDETGSYIYNSRDLCAIEFLDKVIDAGVDSLKIEGRNKGILYGAVTARVYRQAIDSYQNGVYPYSPRWREELQTFTHRGYTSGFYLGGLDKGAQSHDGKTHHPYQLAAKVVREVEPGWYLVHTRNQIRTGMMIDAVYADRDPQSAVIDAMRDVDAKCATAVVHPNNYVEIKIDLPLSGDDLLRSKETSGPSL